jgi:hypothetical protein
MITAVHPRWDEWAMAYHAGDVAKLETLDTSDVFRHMDPFMMALWMDGALQHGHPHVVDWLLGFADMDRFGGFACWVGSVALAKYVHAKGASGFNDSAFACVCSRGHLHVARWMRAEFQVDKASEWPQMEVRALMGACDEGHLAVLQWLWSFSTFDPRRELRRGFIGPVFHAVTHPDRGVPTFKSLFSVACRRGHLHIAQWLHRQGALDVELVQDADAPLATAVQKLHSNSVFSETCALGCLRVAQWLFGLGVIDLHCFEDAPFRWACSEDQDRVAKWLLSLDPEYTAWPEKALRQLQYQCWTPERDVWMRSIAQRS